MFASQSYGATIDDVFAVELSAGPSLDEIMKLPNKVLLWCGAYHPNFLIFFQGLLQNYPSFGGIRIAGKKFSNYPFIICRS